MTKCFFRIFLSVLFAHILIIFGLSMNFSGDSFSRETYNSMKVRVGTLTQINLPKPPKKKLLISHQNVLEDLPSLNDLDQFPVNVTETAAESHLNQQVISDIKSLYQTELRARIESNKSYPTISKRLGQTGLVIVAFTLLADGSIINARISTSSKFERLNQSALQAVVRVGRFKPFPLEIGEKQMEISVPIKFSEI